MERKVFRKEPICRIIGNKLHNNLQILKECSPRHSLFKDDNVIVILLFSIVRNVISVSSQVSGHKSQGLLFGGVIVIVHVIVTSLSECSVVVFFNNVE